MSVEEMIKARFAALNQKIQCQHTERVSELHRTYAMNAFNVFKPTERLTEEQIDNIFKNYDTVKKNAVTLVQGKFPQASVAEIEKLVAIHLFNVVNYSTVN